MVTHTGISIDQEKVVADMKEYVRILTNKMYIEEGVDCKYPLLITALIKKEPILGTSPWQR